MPHLYRQFYFITRAPIEVATYTSIVRPFTPLVWLFVAVALFFLLISTYVTYSMYSSNGYLFHERLHKPGGTLINFAIDLYFKMTEPEALDWFESRWSTGRWLSLLWAFLCFFIIAFYNTNLRAHLAAIGYEPAIETNQDVVNNGKRVWIMTEMDGNLYARLCTDHCNVIR